MEKGRLRRNVKNRWIVILEVFSHGLEGSTSYFCLPLLIENSFFGGNSVSLNLLKSFI